MKKNKLHQWSALFFIFAVIAAGCSQKSFPSNSSGADEKYESAAVTGSNSTYLPPPVIIITDEKAKTNKEGELYYDDAYGYRYWKYSDGKFYLDQKYDNTSGAKRKIPNRKKIRKSTTATDPAGITSNR